MRLAEINKKTGRHGSAVHDKPHIPRHSEDSESILKGATMSADQQAQNPQSKRSQDAQATQQIQDTLQTQHIADAKTPATDGKANANEASIANTPAGEAVGGKATGNGTTANSGTAANGDTMEAPNIDGVSWNWAATHRGETQHAAVGQPTAQARQAAEGPRYQPSQAAGQPSPAGTVPANDAGRATGAGAAQIPPQASPYGYAPQAYPQQPQYQSPYGAPGAYPAPVPVPAGNQKKPKKPSKIRAFFASLNTGTIVFAAVAALICGLLGGVAGGFIVRATTPSRQQQTVQPYGYGRMMPGSSNESGSGSSSGSSNGSESDGSSSSSDDSSLGLGLGGSSIFNDTGSM